VARRDLTNEEIEQMGRENPGSAAEYLRLRREEIEAEKEKEREQEEKERFLKEFMAAGGTSKVEGEKAYKAHKNQQAAQAARAADEQAAYQWRRRMASKI
jgi:hypothetical protein